MILSFSTSFFHFYLNYVLNSKNNSSSFFDFIVLNILFLFSYTTMVLIDAFLKLKDHEKINY